MSYYSESGAQQVAILLHSGSYDRVTNALSLASVCMAMNMEVTILLTYEGIRRFIKDGSEDPGRTDEELMGMIQKGIDGENIRSIRDKLTGAKELGLRLFACTNAMSIMGLTLEDMVEEVDDLMGLATFIQFARNASINWYI
ncbi:DsrE/DsrF/DrsH-like family protein [Chloroflexota bacterium]